MAGPVADYLEVKERIFWIERALDVNGRILAQWATDYAAKGARLWDTRFQDHPTNVTWGESFSNGSRAISNLARQLNEAHEALRGGLETTRDFAAKLRPRPGPWVDAVREIPQQVVRTAGRIPQQVVPGPQAIAAAEAAAAEAAAAAADAAAITEGNLPAMANAVEANAPRVAGMIESGVAAIEANAAAVASAVEAGVSSIANAGAQFVPQVAAAVEENAPTVVPAAVAAGTAVATAAEGGVGAGVAGGSFFGPVGVAIAVGIAIAAGWWVANRDTTPAAQTTKVTLGAPIVKPPPPPPPPPPIVKKGGLALEAIPGTYGIDVSGDNTCPFFATREGHSASFDVTLDGTTVTLAFNGGAFVGTIQPDYTFGATARDDNLTGTITGQFVQSSDSVAIRDGYFKVAADQVQCSTTFTGQKQV